MNYLGLVAWMTEFGILLKLPWNHDPVMRPTASKIVEYFGNLPDRPSDPRPLDYFDKALPSHMLSYDCADHPFSTLALDHEEIQDGSVEMAKDT
jgi:hypothetical protein